MKNKRNLDKTQQNKTMNDIISTLPDPVNEFANQTESGIILNNNDSILNINNEKVYSIKESPEIKSEIEYNRNVLNLEKEYSPEEIDIIDGGILIRLIKKISCKNNFEIVQSVPVIGGKQLKPEMARDPYKFNNIGIIVNYDKTYDKRNEIAPGNWRLNIGDIVQISPFESMTIIRKLENVTPYLENSFFKYNEARHFHELGYIKLKSQNIICKLPKFDMEEYIESHFKK